MPQAVPSLSRRRVLGATAITALAAPVLAEPLLPSLLGATLIELCAEHRRLRDRFWALEHRGGDTDADYDRLQDALAPLQRRIVATPARTLEEVRAKAGVLSDLYGRDGVDLWGDGGAGRTADVEVLYSILADLGVR